MKRTKLKDRILPTYTKGEEIFNMVSHIVGGGIGVIALIVCIILSIVHKNIYGVISSIIFGTTIILLYTMSSIYHGLNAELKAKKVLQVIDHCSIFLLIAGSYTPFALCTLREYNATLGWTILGIVLNAIDLKKYKVFSMICYLLMGWCIIIKASVLPQLLTPVGFALLLVGGIVYTIGAILYGAGKKHKWMHSIFHLACVLGSLLHFLCVAIYVV